MASREGDEHILQGCGVRTEFGERNVLAGQLGEQSGYGQMQLGDLHFYGAVLRSNVAHALDFAERGNIEGTRIGTGRKRDHVLRANGGDQFAWRTEGDLFAVIHDGHAFAQALRLVHVVRG